MDIKEVLRKTSNYNMDIVVEDFNGNQLRVATCYATFTTGESVSKTMVINNETIYNQTKDQVNEKIAIFNKEVEDLAKFHNVPIV